MLEEKTLGEHCNLRIAYTVDPPRKCGLEQENPFLPVTMFPWQGSNNTEFRDLVSRLSLRLKEMFSLTVVPDPALRIYSASLQAMISLLSVLLQPDPTEI